MKNDTIFLYLIASVSFLFALYNALAFWAKRNITGKTTGTINSITSPNPETAKTRNSKWAKVTYRVDGKTYVSGNRIQVPLTAQVGNSVTVRYDLQHPERLYSYSLARILVSLFVTAVCIVVGVFHLA